MLGFGRRWLLDVSRSRVPEGHQCPRRVRHLRRRQCMQGWCAWRRRVHWVAGSMVIHRLRRRVRRSDGQILQIRLCIRDRPAPLRHNVRPRGRRQRRCRIAAFKRPRMPCNQRRSVCRRRLRRRRLANRLPLLPLQHRVVLLVGACRWHGGRRRRCTSHCYFAGTSRCLARLPPQHGGHVFGGPCITLLGSART